MNPIVAKAVNVANWLDFRGEKEAADIVDSLVSIAAEAPMAPPGAAPAAPGQAAPAADPHAAELLALVKKMRDQASKEEAHGKENPEEAGEEKAEATQMNAWADQLVKMFSLKEEKPAGAPEPAGDQEEVAE